jgi:DNA modification methylase
MSAPYYADDLVTLYLGDCREITAWLGADVLVTDPPYGMSYVSNSSKYGSTEPIAGDDTPELRDTMLERWGDRPALVFGTWRVPRPAATRTVLVWDKNLPSMGDLSLPWHLSWEEVYVLGSGWRGARESSVIRIPGYASRHPDRLGHPTPKPVALMEALLLKAPPGVVADPFTGSGSTLVAASHLGRRAIGVEFHEPYCELLARRLDQGTLFGEAS